MQKPPEVYSYKWKRKFKLRFSPPFLEEAVRTPERLIPDVFKLKISKDKVVMDTPFCVGLLVTMTIRSVLINYISKCALSRLR